MSFKSMYYKTQLNSVYIQKYFYICYQLTNIHRALNFVNWIGEDESWDSSYLTPKSIVFWKTSITSPSIVKYFPLINQDKELLFKLEMWKWRPYICLFLLQREPEWVFYFSSVCLPLASLRWSIITKSV